MKVSDPLLKPPTLAAEKRIGLDLRRCMVASMVTDAPPLFAQLGEALIGASSLGKAECFCQAREMGPAAVQAKGREDSLLQTSHGPKKLGKVGSYSTVWLSKLLWLPSLPCIWRRTDRAIVLAYVAPGGGGGGSTGASPRLPKLKAIKPSLSHIKSWEGRFPGKPHGFFLESSNISHCFPRLTATETSLHTPQWR